MVVSDCDDVTGCGSLFRTRAAATSTGNYHTLKFIIKIRWRRSVLYSTANRNVKRSETCNQYASYVEVSSHLWPKDQTCRNIETMKETKQQVIGIQASHHHSLNMTAPAVTRRSVVQLLYNRSTDRLLLRIWHRTAKQLHSVRIDRSESRWMPRSLTVRTDWLTVYKPTIIEWFVICWRRTHRTSVFGVLNCSGLDNIHNPTSLTHAGTRLCNCTESRGRQKT